MKNVKNWTKAEAESFIIGCLLWVGPCFHPDTPMSDYIDGEGNPLFDASEAGLNQVKLTKAYGLLGESIYDILMHWAAKLGHVPAPDAPEFSNKIEMEARLSPLRLTAYENYIDMRWDSCKMEIGKSNWPMVKAFIDYNFYSFQD